MNLTEQLKKFANDSVKRHPGVAQDIMKKAIETLESKNILSHALKTGEHIDDFELPNASGNKVRLETLLTKGKVVLTFYRGGWCPYCNIQLKALQEALPAIKAKGATLVAVTPETPDNTLSTSEKNALSFEVLTSQNNTLARNLGLVYTLPEDLVSLYGKFGIDLEKSQGNVANELPIAATYVIGQDRKVIYHFLEEDYKLRASIESILNAL